ncbi:hypothetical protein SMGD1_1109 [Sulfurimonas gotlandica GD1]|uniref:VCBS repeat-containing protein n=1 Tax=Sulfurimonas gotlandica (strain DSM 19862 / JCM 16533 / GD1) TaxID=929558 RepID=B6BGK6_SULGG|nr:hypothetical protein [Sulfurimonas gotlandica]EDZ63025.1 conserved hypothetical protein [Sulfurimonas gotlandica GD1]EHP29633.1 hypothetical protein SMGD1_1109 [Sulfurimonas gotlandica GD1]
MKIESHEIAMQSKHELRRVELETQMSFSTFFTGIPVGKEATANIQNMNKAKPQDEIGSYFDNRVKTLEGIIQNLINMLSSRTQSSQSPQELQSPQEDILGYTHLSFFQRYEEHEKLDFSTLGHIKTDKGDLDINLNFSMSRSFVIENNIDIYSAFDPLVINLDGDIPDLSSDTFSFDLDNDGKSDQISMLGARSGFLALDKNSDGIVNQGSELFGTLTGNGFGELSEYDIDGNHWIDENDSIFDKLRIWFKNGDDNEKELVGLGEVGIGAIFLDSASSEFTYKTNTNQTLGEMKSCGMFLNEDGTCGNISQIDFASRAKEQVGKKRKEEFEIAQANANVIIEEPLATLLQA